MDKITVTQDDVEAAKDEGATFVLEELAEMVGVSDWSIQDGSESWEGDVSATAYHILVQAKVINDWDNSVARHQTDAQMAAPDGPAKRLQEIADGAGFDDVYGIVWPHEHGVVRRDLKAILASLSASNAMRDALEEARLTLAHARVFIGSRQKMHPDGQKLYDEAIAHAEAALAGQGTTLDRQTVERVLEPDDLLPSYCRLLDAMQGDDPDAVDSAFHASIEAVSKFGLLRASMDPNHVR